MRRFLKFLRAVGKHWGVLVTGGVFVGAVGLWQGTGHPVKPSVYWALAMVGFFIACHKAWNDQLEEAEKARSALVETRKEWYTSPSSSDPILVLIRERQRLEAELQPLLEIEESGIKVIPAMKIGKDESDYRLEKIGRIRRDVQEIEKELTSLREASITPTPAPSTASDWQALGSRFEKLPTGIRADWNRMSNGVETWNIGGTSKVECESLCQLAGAMLLRSAKVAANLSEVVRGVSNPAHRWLYFLKEAQSGLTGYQYAFEVGDDGTQKPIYFGSINDLGRLSYTSCIRCSAEEV
jgi:hypothetical protein